MAANKFATMLHRNTHKLTVILVYALLEWILIIFLLLNSLFTYLITKFANYFGLKPPCPWCSKVDHMLEPGTSSNYRDLVCATHATEISKLSYCTNHHRLAETQNMCMDCLAARPNHSDESNGIRRRVAFISWVSKDTFDNGERTPSCSCCNESLRSDLYPSYLLLKPFWGALKYTPKGNLYIEAIDDDNNGNECEELSKADSLAHCIEDRSETERKDGEEQHMHEAADGNETLFDAGRLGLKDAAEEDCSRPESNLHCDEKELNEDMKAVSPDGSYQDACVMKIVHPSFNESVIQCCLGEDDSLEIMGSSFERHVDCEINRLIPVELIDSSTTADHVSIHLTQGDVKKKDHQNEIYDFTLQIETHATFPREEVSLYMEDEEEMEGDVGKKSSALNLQEMKNDLVDDTREPVISLQSPETPSAGGEVEVAEINESDDLPAAPDAEADEFNLRTDQTKSRPFIEPSHHATTQSQEQEPTPLPCLQEDHSSKNSSGAAEILNAPETCIPRGELGSNYCDKVTVAENTLTEKNQERMNHHLSTYSQLNEAEEEKSPETPNSVDSIHYLQKKLLLLEKKESGTEESLDGSVLSEMDYGDPTVTVERLKTALKSERKALNALYSELEEERSASAIAANQTMAMINRLQEEKAAMQMEALQYQRMMEEQSEYDQEALQLLNELMIKREKEKQELEKELEVYRKKVLDYEAKDKIRTMRRIKSASVRSRNSSATCSNAEDIDEISIDLNREARDEDICIYGNQESSSNNTPGDEVINLEEIALDCVKQMSALDDSLAEFDEERLSILDQLKALEEKLLNLREDESAEDVNCMGVSPKYSGKGLEESCELSTPEETDVSNELSVDGQYPDQKTMCSMVKSLLPLLDAADNGTEEGLIFEENEVSQFVEMQSSAVSKLELEGEKLTIEDEVDHVYERLQALEADREFLKHCMSSIKKGDKGMDLLQEILQHLRDLRAVELRVRNVNEDPME